MSNYIVQSGDTLAKIAALHGTGLGELIRLNHDLLSRPGRSADRIFVGDSVIVRNVFKDLKCEGGILPLFRCRVKTRVAKIEFGRLDSPVNENLVGIRVTF